MAIELTSSEIKDLREAMSWSRKRLHVFRAHRKKAIQEYVGNNYGEDGSEDAMPINYLELAIVIYSQLLAASAPQVMVSTRFSEFKPSAADLQLATNHLIDRISLADTMRRAVVDALFCMGIVKTGLQVGGYVNLEGIDHEVGQPFADVVSLDNWVHDCEADSYNKIEYAGDSYWVPFKKVKESDGIYNPEALKKLKPTEASGLDKETNAAEISRGPEQPVSFRKKVKLWDIWLPQENLIVTVPDGQEDLVLRTVEWGGPVTGPYHILSYGVVPNNIVPLSPLMMIRDINGLANGLFRKLGRQADRQKTVTFVRAGSPADGDRIVSASDGDTIKVDDPGNVGEATYGGPDPKNQAFLMQMDATLNRFGGNLDMLGGLAPQSDTVGQDQLLASQSSKRIEKMQEATYAWAKGICHDLAWHLWEDPLIQLPLTKRVQGVDLEIPTWFSPDSRKGEFLDYNFNIAPYSMQKPSPTVRLQQIMGLVQQLGPLMPYMQQQGGTLKIEGLLRLYAQFTGVDEIDDLFAFMEPSEASGSPVGDPPAKAAMTNRTYTRVNKGGVTTQGKREAMIGTMLGQNLQDSEQSMMAR